jgi:hypothetical protein
MDWADGIIAYRDDYSITNLADLLLQLSIILNNLKVLPPTFIREEWKRIIKEFDGKIPPDRMTAILSEIDRLSDKELVDGYRLSDIKAMQGIPSTANLVQGNEQEQLGTDRRIGAKQKSRAATKESNPDANRRTSVKRR